MTINVKHFDTLTRQDLDVEENIKNSLAEYLFPDTEFAIGSIYQDITTSEHLDQYQEKTLQFASGERMYFADSSARSLVYPNQSDGAAYGSLVFTPCQEFKEVEARVLVVDHETGANGGILPPETAKELVGDCYGKISPQIAEQLTGVMKTPFQFRLGIKPQTESPVYRIAKGTLAPAVLDNLSGAKVVTTRSEQGKLITKTGYDLILPTSSFKGRKEGYDPIEPGEYNLTVGIGIKTLAQYGEQSLGTQVLVNYPKAVSCELLPTLQDEADKLAANQSSPQQLAQHYIELYEQRKEAMRVGEIDESNFNYAELEGFDQIIDEAFGDEIEIENTTEQDWTLYRLLKADTQGKITEHPKIVDELNKFVRKRWVEIATGRAIKFQAGLAQPSLKLKEDEICIPHIPPGKEVIVTRSPLINSNGVIVLKNRHLPEVQHLQGVVHINPDTAAKCLQCDYDGDRLAFETADKYPVLAAEVKEYNLEQNRYPDIVKKDKVAYKGTFQEIALSAAENKIGLIANQIQRAVANKWETYGLPDAQKPSYIKEISQKMKALLEDNSVAIPQKYQERVNQLANFPQQPKPQEIDQALENLRSLNFDLVADLGNELQVAVDGPKSAARPDEAQLKNLKAIGGYKYPQWLYEKKNPKAYQNRPMKSNGYSPIDLMIRQTNKTFQESQLKESPTVSFRPFFEDVPFTNVQEQRAKNIKDTYNALIGKAIEAQKREDKPVLKVTSATSSKTIEITDLKSFSSIWRVDKLDIGIRAHPEETKQNRGTLRAVVIQDNGIEQDVGILSAEQVKEFGLKHGHSLRGAAVALDSGITKAPVKAMFSQATDYLEKIRQETPQSEKQAIASALWHVTHTKGKDNYNKKATVALNLFLDEVIKQLQKSPLQDLKAVGVLYSGDYGDRIWKGETVDCEIVKNPDKQYTSHSDKLVLVEGKPLAPLSIESSSFPVGTKFKASITTPLGASVIATTPLGNSMKLTEIKNGAYPNLNWKGESAKIKLGWQIIKGKEKAVALFDGKRLGILDKDSTNKVESRGLVTSGSTLPVTLVRSPATTADLKVDVGSIVYPWQSSEKQAEAVSVKENNSLSSSKQSESIALEENLSTASIVAPIVQDFLKLKGTDHYQGQKYNAAWNKDTQTLILENANDSSIKLSAQLIDGEWQPQRNNLTVPDVEYFQDMKPKIQAQLKSNLTIEQKKQLFRQEYERLREQVHSNPNHHNAEFEKVDLAIAMLVLSESAQNNQSKNLLNRVGQVLSQSDRLREWKQSMPEGEYKTSAQEYIIQTFEKASQIRENILSARQHNLDLVR